MKTQILQLEPHDDAISTRDKMGWSQTGRILLVWPHRGRILARRLDLLLLLRHSRALGAQLALVTKDPDVRFHARLLGISVFKSVRQAQEARWERPHDRQALARGSPLERRVSALTPSQRLPPQAPGLPAPALEAVEGPAPSAAEEPAPSIAERPALRRGPEPFSPSSGGGLFEGRVEGPARLGFFTLGVLAFLSLAAALLPGAEVMLAPRTQTQELTLSVQASPSRERVNISGLVPVRAISMVEEGRDSLNTTGTMLVPEQPARGKVVFTNLTDRAISVPAGTVVSTLSGSVRFATDRAGEVPAGPGQTLTLPITALTLGRQGNLPTGRIQAIFGLLGVNLTASNPEPTTGGRERSSPAPSRLDYDRLAKQLASTLQASAREEIEAGLGLDDLLLTPEPLLVKALEETFEPPEQQPASQLTLSSRLEFQALIVSGDDLRELATSALDANLPEGYVPLAGTLDIEHLTRPALDDANRARWQMRVHRTLQARLAEPQAANLALGLTPTQAGQRLADALPLNSPPRISLTPSWWPRLPIIPFRIQVVITGGQE